MKIRINARIVLCASMAFLLAACGSSSPSESDAKQAVQAELGDCKYVHMSDFTRVNGQQATDENHYEVQVKYTVTLEADSDQKEKLQAQLDRFTQRNDLIKQQMQILKNYQAQGTGDSPYNDPTWKDDDQKQKAFYQEMATSYGTAAFEREFRQACPSFPEKVFFQLLTKTDGAVFNGKNALDFSYMLPMVKTDNGWQLDR